VIVEGRERSSDDEHVDGLRVWMKPVATVEGQRGAMMEK